MPGVLVLEGMAQTAGTLCIRSLPGQDKPTLVYFLTIDKAKFRKPVVPGDMLEYHMKRIARRRNMWWFRGEAKVGGEIVAEAELGAMIAEAERAARSTLPRASPMARGLPTTSRSVRSASIGPQVELRAGVRLLSHVNLAGVDRHRRADRDLSVCFARHAAAIDRAIAAARPG